jgi:SAM-dependent methyltransferase
MVSRGIPYDRVVLKPLQRMRPALGVRLAADAASHPLAAPGVAYEQWYLKRWHCLPEGYLSARSVAWYDRAIRPLYICGREATVAAHVARYARTGRVLDGGCGTGALLARLRRLRPGLELAGLDLSPYAVAAARARLADGMAVRHGDLRWPPFAPASFETVLLAHVLGHVPRAVADAITVAAARLLAPGGRLVTVEHRWHGVVPTGFVRAGRRRAGFGLLLVEAWTPSAT